MSKDERRRMNIKLPDEIIDFYKEMGDRYSVPYTNYISMILTQIYEKEMEKRFAIEFNENIKAMKEMSDGTMSPEEMMRESKSIMENALKLNLNQNNDK